MNRELRESIINTVKCVTEISYIDDEFTVEQLGRAIENYNDIVTRLDRAIDGLQWQLDLDDWREYQATHPEVALGGAKL